MLKLKVGFKPKRILKKGPAFGGYSSAKESAVGGFGISKSAVGGVGSSKPAVGGVDKSKGSRIFVRGHKVIVQRGMAGEAKNAFQACWGSKDDWKSTSKEWITEKRKVLVAFRHAISHGGHSRFNAAVAIDAQTAKKAMEEPKKDEEGEASEEKTKIS